MSHTARESTQPRAVDHTVKRRVARQRRLEMTKPELRGHFDPELKHSRNPVPGADQKHTPLLRMSINLLASIVSTCFFYISYRMLYMYCTTVNAPLLLYLGHCYCTSTTSSVPLGYCYFALIAAKPPPSLLYLDRCYFNSMHHCCCTSTTAIALRKLLLYLDASLLLYLNHCYCTSTIATESRCITATFPRPPLLSPAAQTLIPRSLRLYFECCYCTSRTVTVHRPLQ